MYYRENTRRIKDARKLQLETELDILLLVLLLLSLSTDRIRKIGIDHTHIIKNTRHSRSCGRCQKRRVSQIDRCDHGNRNQVKVHLVEALPEFGEGAISTLVSISGPRCITIIIMAISVLTMLLSEFFG